MAEAQLSNEDKSIINFLASLEKLGINITNRDGMIAWFKDKITRGATLPEIKQILQEQNYDFKKTHTIIEAKLESRTASKKVDALETKIKTEEETKKQQSQLQFIITAFLIAIISVGSSWFISKQVSDIDTSVLGDTGGILTTFIKAGWIIGIAAGFVGLLLITMFISEKYKNKKIIPLKDTEYQKERSP
ncbi:MAG: hypothetical protein V1914_03835 [archaeon]